MNSNQTILFDQFIPWARRMGSNWARVKKLRGLDKIFAQSIAEEGLWDAALRFDPKCGTKFRNYAILRIRGVLGDWTRSMSYQGRSKYTRHIRVIQLGGGDPGILDHRSEISFLCIENKDRASRILNSIPKGRHRDVLRLIYLRGMTAEKISKLWKCGASRVSQVKSQALELARAGSRSEGGI